MTYPEVSEIPNRYTVQPAEWDSHGWVVTVDGRVIDTYPTAIMAQAYADYQNNRPDDTRIRTEWAPEQVALTESERKAHEVQQQRIEQLRSGAVRPIPTVCPKR